MAKKFSTQFMQEAVSYAKSHPQCTIRQNAQALGIGHSTLSKWLGLQKKCDPIGSQTLSQEQQRIRQLEKECIHLREVNEILKKAHVYFINHPNR
jgi:transposase